MHSAVLDRLLGGQCVFFFSSCHNPLPAPRLVLLLVRLTSVALVGCCPFSCGVLSACFASYVAIVSVDTACNEGCGFCCWLHVHLHAAACAWLVFGALGLWGSWARGVLCGRARRSALRAPSLRWSRLRIAVVRLSRPPPVGNPARAPQCWSAAPVQCSARAGLQVARICPKMPAAGVLKAYCQGGLLPLPRPSCWGLHVRGPMGKLSLTRLVYPRSPIV